MSEPPVQVIRDDSPHKVEMSEHSKVAVSKTGEAGAPSVRKVLAVPEAQVTEQVAAQEHRVRVPEALPGVASGKVLVPPPMAAGEAAELEIPEGLAPAARSDLTIPAGQDQAVAALQIPAGQSADALHSLDIPAGQGADAPTLDIPAGQDTDVPTLDIPAGDGPATPQLTLTPGTAPSERIDSAAIHTLLSELNVAASTETVQEQLGGPGAVWVEMDYPARVVKLKIENDKVRGKLDTLERALGSPAAGA